jgi:hypothetical protein
MTTYDLAEALHKMDPDFKIETLEDEMKMELLIVAFNKFTLEQLEEKLGGTKYSL